MIKKSLIVLLLFIMIFSGVSCNHSSADIEANDSHTKEYYTLDDFDFLTINQSTDQDIIDRWGSIRVAMTSFGGVSQFPMENGDYIIVYFYGSEMIVGDIIVDSEPFYSNE